MVETSMGDVRGRSSSDDADVLDSYATECGNMPGRSELDTQYDIRITENLRILYKENVRMANKIFSAVSSAISKTSRRYLSDVIITPGS
ncbi:hypothetical protein CEXT_712071 [Caerostris extrusa]|uniref:Uncharacterized protein n=1 Tax=Caerostris extrusa TaxID=172846 RepID=A0AAV4QQ33_CAEEX|nr:hypothetical protein CEXT_712071 [Caerostris extrusa]